ncbi:MAG: hypothetical protein RL187_920 [Actinomycetota bacterium]|jgi:prevent-host-death family protein
MSEKTVSELRENLADALNELDKEPVEIFRHGRRIAVMVSPMMFDKAMDALEERADEAAYDEVDRDDTLPWDEVKRELGLS